MLLGRIESSDWQTYQRKICCQNLLRVILSRLKEEKDKRSCLSKISYQSLPLLSPPSSLLIANALFLIASAAFKAPAISSPPASSSSSSLFGLPLPLPPVFTRLEAPAPLIAASNPPRASPAGGCEFLSGAGGAAAVLGGAGGGGGPPTAKQNKSHQ